MEYHSISLSQATANLNTSLKGDSVEDALEHFGIQGMKWGRRRYQNPDGSLTAAGRQRYGVGEAREGNASGGSDTTTTAKTSSNTSSSSSSSSSGTITRTISSNGSTDPRTMTDAELNAAVNRLSQEQRYLTLMSQLNPKTESLGEKVCNSVVDSLSKGVTKGLTTATAAIIATTIKDAVNSKNNKNTNK